MRPEHGGCTVPLDDLDASALDLRVPGTTPTTQAATACRSLEAMMDDYWICACGSELADGGDHRRCWMLDAYDHDDLRSALR